MASLRCLCLQRLRTAGILSSTEGQLLLLRSGLASCHGNHAARGQTHHPPVHSCPSLGDKTFIICPADGLKWVQHGASPARQKRFTQVIMKRTMGNRSSDSRASTAQSDDEELSGQAKYGRKSDTEVSSSCAEASQADVQMVSQTETVHVDQLSGSSEEKRTELHVFEKAATRGTDLQEALHSTGLSEDLCLSSSSPFIDLLAGGKASSTPEPSGSHTTPSTTQSPKHCMHSSSHPLTKTLITYPPGYLYKHGSVVSTLEAFRYYRPVPQTNLSPEDKSQCHILYEEEPKAASEGRARPRQEPRERRREALALDSPVYVSSDSPISISSSSATCEDVEDTTLTGAREEEEVELSDTDGSSSTPLASPAVAEDKNSDVSREFNKAAYWQKLRQLPRAWEFTPFGRRYEMERQSWRGTEFTVMTYNILAQDLLENHPHLYTHCRPHTLTWNHRRQRLLAEIELHKPDILNMQEVQQDHFHNHMLPVLRSLGYRGVYQKRSNSSDGCVTLWREDKFRLLRSTPVNYQRGELLDRDNIAIIVELIPANADTQHKTSGKEKLVVANTHLLFNPKRGDVKLAQLMVLMAEIDRCAYMGPTKSGTHAQRQHAHLHPNVWSVGESEGSYCPVIMTGDFNLEPYSELYNFLIKGHLDYDGLLIREMSGQEEGQYGYDHFLDRHFFSPTFGITERCQYHMEVRSRMKGLAGLGGSPSTPVGISHQPPAIHSASDSLAAQSTPATPAGGPGVTDEANATGAGDRATDTTQTLEAPHSTHVPPSTTTSSHVRDEKAFSARAEWDSLPVITPILPPMRINTGSLWHHLNLISAYKHRIERLQNHKEEVTTHHSRAACTVDYIFYTVRHKDVYKRGHRLGVENIRDDRLRLIGRYGLMSAQELGRLGGIPGDTLASDHVFLMAKFLLK